MSRGLSISGVRPWLRRFSWRGTLEGRLVVNTGNAVFHLGRFVESPATIIFREGKAVKFHGGLDAFLLRDYLHSFQGENRFENLLPLC